MLRLFCFIRQPNRRFYFLNRWNQQIVFSRQPKLNKMLPRFHSLVLLDYRPFKQSQPRAPAISLKQKENHSKKNSGFSPNLNRSRCLINYHLHLAQQKINIVSDEDLKNDPALKYRNISHLNLAPPKSCAGKTFKSKDWFQSSAKVKHFCSILRC